MGQVLIALLLAFLDFKQQETNTLVYLERLPLKELCWEEWLEYELKEEERLRERDDPEPVYDEERDDDL